MIPVQDIIVKERVKFALLLDNSIMDIKNYAVPNSSDNWKISVNQK
ncbi:360_t:CDS:1, partial [Acaulospora colombiana]